MNKPFSPFFSPLTCYFFAIFLSFFASKRPSIDAGGSAREMRRSGTNYCGLSRGNRWLAIGLGIVALHANLNALSRSHSTERWYCIVEGSTAVCSPNISSFLSLFSYPRVLLLWLAHDFFRKHSQEARAVSADNPWCSYVFFHQVFLRYFAAAFSYLILPGEVYTSSTSFTVLTIFRFSFSVCLLLLRTVIFLGEGVCPVWACLRRSGFESRLRFPLL